MIKKQTEIPTNLEAETSVVGSIIIDPTCLDVVRSIVTPIDFHDDCMRKFFSALLTLDDAGRPLNDIHVVVDHLRQVGVLDALGGVPGVARAFHSVPYASHATYYAKLVKSNSDLRKQIAIGQELVRRAMDCDAPEENRAWVEAQLGATGDVPSGARSVGEIAAESVASITDDVRRKRSPGVMSGLLAIDEILGPMQCGELIIIAARPSIGKTALGLQIAEHVATRGKRALVVSLEMRDRELVDRMLASYSGINGRKIRARTLSETNLQELSAAAAELTMPLYVWAPYAATIAQIRGLAKLEAVRGGLSLLVVDYLGLIRPADKFRPRHEQVAECTAQLKSLAKELDVPILCLCQLNRAAESERPTLANLRDSGAVEQDADVVLFLHKEGRADARAELIVAKSRNGVTSDGIVLEWDGVNTRFWCREAQPVEAFNEFNNA